MEISKIKEIIPHIKYLSYEDKKKIYLENFSIGYVSSSELNDRLALISLVALVYQRMKITNPNVTALQILQQITKQKKDNSYFYFFLEALAIFVEDISYGIKKIDPFGLKTSKDIINKIKDLLNTWIPF